MKKLSVLLCALALVLSPLPCSLSAEQSEKEELIQILHELKSLNDEQQTIIENSQKRNLELEALLEKQQKTIEELQNSSEVRQQIIEGQQKLLDELQSSSKEQKKSSISLPAKIAAGAAVFLGGCLTGLMIGNSK